MFASHPVIDDLRQRLATARSAAPFIEEVGSRAQQLLANMVDGRVQSKADADALRTALIEFVRTEALPQIARRNPGDALRLIDTLKAFRLPQLEGERAQLEAARAAKFPAPRAASWEELAVLRAAAEEAHAVCLLSPGALNSHFAQELQKNDGLVLPDDLLALYAACDGFDLACRVARHIPVFSLLPSSSIDVSEPEATYPRRAVPFQGGDAVQLAVYRDANHAWWLVYEYDYQPLAQVPFELRALLRFGIARMNAATANALLDELSWERFFKLADRDS